MMKRMLISHLLLLIFILAGCSKDNGGFFEAKIENDPGVLTILNESGFIGAAALGNTITHELVLFAAGGLDLTNLNATLTTTDPFTYLDGTYPGTGGTCGTSLKSGEQCTIVIFYEPTNIASHRADFHFTYQDKLGSKSLDYVMTADSHPILLFEYGTTYDFGNKFIGSSTDLTIRVTNTGSAAAESVSINNLTLPYSFKDGTYPGTGGTCGTQVNIGDSCDIVINYSPTGNGEHLQDITFDYLNTGNPEQSTLSLVAWGFYPAVLTLSDPLGYDFGTVVAGKAHEKTFTVTHSSGDVSATSLSITDLNSPFAFKGGSFPGTGGTCGTVLSKDTGSCTIVLVLDTTSSGTWNNTFTFSYHNGMETISTTRTLDGITKQKPILSFATTGVNDYGLIAKDASANKTFTVTYASGELPATNLGFTTLTAPFSYAGGSFPGSGGTCTTSISSGSCTIVISFSPTTYATWSRNTYISYDNEITTVNSPLITLQGKTESNLYFSNPSSRDFGNVVAGETANAYVRLYFQGGEGATGIAVNSLTGPFTFRGGSYPGTSGTCSTTMSSGNCLIYLTYSPPAQGSHTGVLTLDYNDGLVPRTVSINLSGTGTPPAVLTIPNTSFGTTSVHSQVERTITVTNSQPKEATSLSIASLPSGFAYKGGNYPGSGGTCGTTLAASSSCNLVLIFSPTSATAYSPTLTLDYFDGALNQSATATLTGTGQNTSSLFIDKFDTTNFGTRYVGQYADIVFTLSHGGSATPATGITPTVNPATDFSIQGTTCGASLVSGASCTITVRFAPQSGGAKGATLQVDYNNGSPQSVARLISGTGIAPALLSFTPSSYNFGLQPYDTTYDQTFTVSRTGTPNATSMSGAITGSGFNFKGGTYPGTGGTCSTWLSGGTCTIVGTFSPSAVQAYSGQVGIRYYNGYTIVQSYVDLTGSGKDTAILTFASATYDFGQIIQTNTTEKIITVNYAGTIAATGLSAGTLSAPYSYKGGSYPGTGGTCGATLSSGSCTIVVEFTPSSTGVQGETLTLDYSNGTSGKQITTSLTGEGMAQAIISISEANPYNFGTTSIGGTINKLFTLINGGGVSGTGLGGSFANSVFTFRGGSFPGTGGNCTTTLTAGNSCTIVLSFTPTAATSYSAMFTLDYNDGLQARTELKTLKGSGSAKLKTDYYLSKMPSSYVNVLEAEGSFDDVITLKENFDSLGFKNLALGDINGNEYADRFISAFNVSGHSPYSFLGVDGFEDEILYYVHNLYPEDIHVGSVALYLDEDRDGDGLFDILIGIYREDGDIHVLTGYDILSSKTGNIIEHYLE